MGTALRLTSAILFFLGAYLIVPRVTTAAANHDIATSQNRAKFNDATLGNSITTGLNLSDSKPNKSKLDSNNGYEPPNYGSPDSEHGSGTR